MPVSRISFFLIFTFLLALPAMAWAESDDPVASYRVSFSDDDKRRVVVEAEIPVADGKIRMASWGHPYLPRGWATFVELAEVTSQNGNPVAFSEDQGETWGAWNLADQDNGIVNLKYTVNLTQDQMNWDQAGGEDSRPSVTDQALFLVTKALFIYSPNTFQKALVELDVPAGWEISSPWQESDGRPGTYEVESWISLVNNALVVGDHEKVVLEASGMTITIAVDKTMAGDIPVFEKTFRIQLAEYVALFGDAPKHPYLVAIRSAEADDGEAFANSFNQVIRPGNLEDRSIVWANTMGHELFHYWNGNLVLVGKEKSKTEWFGEGFTEYYSSLTLFRAGLISEELWLRKLEIYLARHFISTRMWPEEPISLVEAGKDKHRNWLRVYGGGATLALALDIEIRDATGGNKGLDDVMRLLASRFGFDNRKYEVNDVLAAVNEVSGQEFDSLFETVVWSASPELDFEYVLSKAGLNMEHMGDEFYLTRARNPSQLQQKILRGITSSAQAQP